VIAWNEKNGRMLIAAPLKRFCQALPKIGTGIRIVEDVTHAEDSIYGVSSRYIEDSPHYIHAGAR
jgi:hypothetical protein